MAPTTICCTQNGARPTIRSRSFSDPSYRPADGTPLDLDGNGPQPAIPTCAKLTTRSNRSQRRRGRPQSRTISNLIVDQTLGNPAAILTALQRAGIEPTAGETNLISSRRSAPLISR